VTERELKELCTAYHFTACRVTRKREVRWQAVSHTPPRVTVYLCMDSRLSHISKEEIRDKLVGVARSKPVLEIHALPDVTDGIT
jgi:hypothetical protein